MSMTVAANEALLSAVAKYEADGYDVSLKERLPEPFAALVADAIARRDVETVVVGIKSANASDWSRKRHAKLTEILRTDCRWRLDIHTYEPNPTPPQPDVEDVERRIREARHIAEVSPEAAVLLVWSAFEGALLWVAHERGIAPKRHLPTRSLIQQLTVDRTSRPGVSTAAATTWTIPPGGLRERHCSSWQLTPTPTECQRRPRDDRTLAPSATSCSLRTNRCRTRRTPATSCGSGDNSSITTSR